MLKSTIKQGGACDWIVGFLLTALPFPSVLFLSFFFVSGSSLFC